MSEASSAPRIRKAYGVTTLSLQSPIIVHAQNASKARAKIISDVQSAWGCSFKDALVEVRSVHRSPMNDIILPARHPLAATLSEKVLHCVTHAYGGSGEKAGYRDHFYASENNWVMRAALYHCLFSVFRRDKGWGGGSDMIMYQLTDLGRNVARGEVATYPECWQ